MNTPIEEILQDGKQRRKSIGTPSSSYGNGGLNLAGGKTRRYSIGIASSQKGDGEKGNVIPNYLRASTGSCHDFCKYGKKHEHSKSAIPITFKRTTIVNKEKPTKNVVPLERKKTKMVAKIELSTDPRVQTPVEHQDVSFRSKKAQVPKGILSTNKKATENELKMPRVKVKPSPMAVNPSLSVTESSESAGSNGRTKKKDIRTVKKTGMTPTVAALKRVIVKTTPIESQSPKPSFSRAASLKAIKHKNLKQVSPLKDQNRMQKNELKKRITDKVQTKSLHGGDAESEAKQQTMEFESISPTIETIQPNSSQFSSDKNVIEEESTITDVVHESSRLFPCIELLEGSSIALPGLESSQSSSEKEFLEGSSLQPPVSGRSQSSYEEEVLEEEFEYTDGEEVESCDEEVSEEEFESIDNEEVFASGNNDEMGTSVGNQSKISRKGRMVISEDKDEEGVKLRFRRGRILDLQSETNGPRRLKFRRRVIEGNEDGQTIARRTYKNKTLDLQTEINSPKRLTFRKGKVMEGHEDKQIARRTFEKKYIEQKDDSNHGPESVVLKHQGEQGKKDAQGLFNNVIEETASKLVESRKSKVKALVGAFETVISLQDAKPSST